MVEVVERTTVLLGLRRGREGALAAGLAELGVGLPKMGRFQESGGLLVARVAPHQVLAMRLGTGPGLMAELAGVAEDAGLIDLSDARVGFRVAGRDAVRRLMQLLPIDLHEARFGPGACAQTMMAHMSVVVLRAASATFELQVGRSYLDSATRAVAAA